MILQPLWVVVSLRSTLEPRFGGLPWVVPQAVRISMVLHMEKLGKNQQHGPNGDITGSILLYIYIYFFFCWLLLSPFLVV